MKAIALENLERHKASILEFLQGKSTRTGEYYSTDWIGSGIWKLWRI